MPQPEPASSWPPVPQVAASVFCNANRYRDEFIHAQPFKHIAIDEFFDAGFAERLLAEFPHFDPELARNEMGEVAGKAVNTRIREISPAYRELFETIGGKPFLELVSQITGIPDLILDPRMYGGGTHENLHGQELDPHVDFNYDEAQKLHRRLNVIVYLNKGWQSEWGGAIEVHSNPRKPETNQIRAFDPVFNRCVMFETNEISWHGFPRITLPPEQRNVSRKSISIYLYTTTRPAEELAPVHGTFYVQRPLPQRYREGLTLTVDDVADLKRQLWLRDIWTEHYHKMELEKNREIDGKNRDIRIMMEQYDKLTAETKAAIAGLENEIRRLTEENSGHDRDLQATHQEISRERDSLLEALQHDRQFVRVPLTGYAVQTQALGGVYGDLWLAPRSEWEIRPIVKVEGLRLRGWRPDGSPQAPNLETKLRVTTDHAKVETQVSSGAFTIDLPFPQPTLDVFRVRVECDPLPPSSTDDRELAFKLMEVRTKHPLLPLLKEARQ
jgi:hypothetical protein